MKWSTNSRIRQFKLLATAIPNGTIHQAEKNATTRLYSYGGELLESTCHGHLAEFRGLGQAENLTDERTAKWCRRKPFRFRKLLNQRATRLAKVFCKMPCSRIKSRLQFRLGSIHYISGPNLPDTQGIACWSRSSFIVETSLRGCDARFL